MVLQRWQSVWLLVSAICVALFCFLPVASIAFEEPAAAAGSFTAITPTDNWAVLRGGASACEHFLVSRHPSPEDDDYREYPAYVCVGRMRLAYGLQHSGSRRERRTARQQPASARGYHLRHSRISRHPPRREVAPRRRPAPLTESVKIRINL